MKKFLGILVVCVQLLSAFGTVALAGNVLGYVYDTDIRAFINGVEVKSYAIDGKTVVAVEEVTKSGTGYYYNDSARALQVYSLAPSVLVEGKSELKDKIGNVVGQIYKTDIKTIIYDCEVPSYNIGGKMAVAIEDLGSDGSFSEFGGKYVWDGVNRTINLEFIYDNSSIVGKHNINMTVDIKDDLSEATVSLSKNPYCKAMLIKDFNWPDWIDDLNGTDEEVKKAIPLVYNGEVLGYHLYRTTQKSEWKPNGFYAYTYLYPEKIEEVFANVQKPEITREDVINHYKDNHLSVVSQIFETDEYTFAYMSSATSHGTTQNLVLIKSDGSYYDYSKDFESVSFWGTKVFQDLIIDKENETVTFHYDVSYEINLKTGELTKLG